MKWAILKHSGDQHVVSRLRKDADNHTTVIYETVDLCGRVHRLSADEIDHFEDRHRPIYPIHGSPSTRERLAVGQPTNWLEELRRRRVQDIQELIQSKRRRGRTRKAGGADEEVDGNDGLGKPQVKARTPRKRAGAGTRTMKSTKRSTLIQGRLKALVLAGKLTEDEARMMAEDM